jgi:hypothetical protein
MNLERLQWIDLNNFEMQLIDSIYKAAQSGGKNLSI